MASRKTKRLVPQRVDAGRRRVLAGFGALGAGTLLSGCDSPVSRNETVQRILGATDRFTHAAQRLLASNESLAREFDRSAIASTFRPNGTTDPADPAYRAMAQDDFRDWRLEIGGKVRRPMKLSLEDLRALPARTQITRHDCVEGWSCIGQWTGAGLGHILDRVEPTADARFVVFRCADNVYGSPDKYYESIDLVEAHHPQTILAYDLNGSKLPIANGAPLRLRVERQLGYKMAKYLLRIELVDGFTDIRGGHGGFWEDRGYDWWAGI